jgi:hypothetical protein
MESDMSPEVLSRLVSSGTKYEKFSDVPKPTNWNNTWLKVSHFGPGDANEDD